MSRSDGDIGRKTAHAAGWAFLATIGSRLATLLALTVLARLLSPEHFGLLAFALVYITYAETIGDLGAGMALIYWRDRRDDAAQLTFVISLVAGVAWFAVTLLAAPAIASFFHSPEGTPVIRVLAFAFLLKYLGTTHDALAQKDLRFRARALPELGLAVFKGGIAIGLALAGFGVWSLVIGHLAGLAVWTTLVWIVVPWRPRLAFPRDLLRPMLGYGRGIVAVNVVAAVVHHADAAIVGRFLGATALGVYHIAYKVPEMSIAVLIWVIGKVLFPAFSRIHAGGGELKRAYLSALRWVSLLTVPAAIGLFLVARPLVLTFFGPQWIAAAPVLRALAVYVGLRSLGTHAGEVLKATGRSAFLARLGVLKALLVVPSLLIAVRSGLVAIAWTLAAVTALTVAINLGVVMRQLRIGIGAIARSLRASLIAGALMALVVAGVLRLLPPLVPLATLAIAVAAGLFSYVAAVRLVDPGSLRELAAVFGKRRADANASLAEVRR